MKSLFVRYASVVKNYSILTIAVRNVASIPVTDNFGVCFGNGTMGETYILRRISTYENRFPARNGECKPTCAGY